MKAPTTIGLQWDQAPFNGGAVIEDYRVFIAVEGEAYSELVTGLVATNYAATGLTEGVTYNFKVQSRNQHGYTQDSAVLTILSAYIPMPPTVVTTANYNDHIIVDWNDPDFNGSPITSYSIYVREHATTTFVQESVDCDGNSADVVTNTGCIIYLSTLTAAPFNLVLNESVDVKIVSTNLYGDSD